MSHRQWWIHTSISYNPRIAAVIAVLCACMTVVAVAYAADPAEEAISNMLSKDMQRVLVGMISLCLTAIVGLAGWIVVLFNRLIDSLTTWRESIDTRLGSDGQIMRALGEADWKREAGFHDVMEKLGAQGPILRSLDEADLRRESAIREIRDRQDATTANMIGRFDMLLQLITGSNQQIVNLLSDALNLARQRQAAAAPKAPEGS